jgi:hypothetical protein
MADDNPFQVIRDAILNAGINHPEAEGRRPPGEQGDGGNADRYARAVLIALEHSGFEIVRHIPEPPDVD